MSKDDERTCGDCWHFILDGMGVDGEHGLAVVLGMCGIDGEMVRSDSPQCSNAPLSHGGTCEEAEVSK